MLQSALRAHGRVAGVAFCVGDVEAASLLATSTEEVCGAAFHADLLSGMQWLYLRGVAVKECA